MDDCMKAAFAAAARKLSVRRRDLHRHPEAAWTEFRTAALAAAELERLGYVIRMGEEAVRREAMLKVPPAEDLRRHQQRAVAQGAPSSLVARMDGGLTGFWADLECGSGPTLCVRFDMDCNEMSERTDPDHRPAREGFASCNPGLMHACGHDGHTAVGLGLAEMLAACRRSLRGRIRLLFQPAEEGARGAVPMAEAGAVRDVDAIVGFHLGFQADDPDVIICGTRNFLATTKADVTFTGRSAHAGAAPEEGRNALLAACTAVLNLHAISRSGKGDTRIAVGRLHAGEGRNVIPSLARLSMETRGVTGGLDAYMMDESRRILRAAADMWGCGHEVNIVGRAGSGESSPGLASVAAEAARESGLFGRIEIMKDFGAAEDFADLMTLVQRNGGSGTYMQIGARLAAGHHNTGFDFDEACLPRALEILARMVRKLNGAQKD